MPSDKRNKRILVICPHPEGFVPGQRLKYEQYFNHWRSNGFEVEVSSFMSVAMQNIVYTRGNYLKKIFGTLDGYRRRLKDVLRIKQYNLVYLFLWATPFGPPFFEWLIRKRAKKVVYDIDDLVFLKNISHENQLLAAIKGKKKPIFMMKHADHIISCTPYLDQIARQYNSNTTDISSTINTDTYLPVNNYENDHRLILGWSGSHSTAKYLYLLKDILLELKKNIDFKLCVMGDSSFNIDGLDIEAIKWNAEAEIPFLQRFDIGLYPLPLDEEWVLGKSGLKALQYMALGIPTIATEVGCNDRVINQDNNGFLVRTKQDWLEKLTLLCENPMLRKAMGENAAAWVRDKYSIKANAPTYLAILQDQLK